jgi:hypothetical protein
MIVKKRDPFTGQENSLDLPVNEMQMAVYRAGATSQQAFPNLTPEQREFIISGILPGNFERNLAVKVDPNSFTQTESGYYFVTFASDLGWLAGEWPELVKFDDGTNFEVFEQHAPFYTETTTHEDRELAGFYYKSEAGKTLKIFND